MHVFRFSFFPFFNHDLMNNFICIIAIILIVAWLVGVTVYGLGGSIHVLVIPAIFAIVFLTIRSEKAT